MALKSGITPMLPGTSGPWGVPVSGFASKARMCVGEIVAPELAWDMACRIIAAPATIGAALLVPLNDFVYFLL